VDPQDLQVGQWYCLGRYLLRYEGRSPKGAYVLSRFAGENPDDPGELSVTVEVYNVEGLTPYMKGRPDHRSK
jgi:hypothetical protein